MSRILGCFTNLRRVFYRTAILLGLLWMAATLTPIMGHTAMASDTPTDFTCASVTTIPAEECQALVDFYVSTGGPQWTNNSGWLQYQWQQYSNPCEWNGIYCGNDHVEMILLYSNNLNGPLPIAIGDLTKLEVLVLYDNELSGTLPPSLGKLTQLKRLWLEGEELSGNLPDSLGALINLERLTLDGSFTGIMPLSLLNLTKLQDLRLRSAPCVPADAVVEAWLATINYVSVWNRQCIIADATNVFLNGSFEPRTTDPNRSWLTASSWIRKPFFTGTAPYTDVQPRTGLSAISLGIYEPTVADMAPFFFDRIQQTITVPIRADVAFSFHYQIRSDEACGRDFAYVFAKMPMQHPVQLGVFDLCQATRTSGWTEAVFDLSTYAGKTVDIYLDVRLDEMNGSVFFVDDVYLAKNPVVEIIDSTHAIFLPAIQRSMPPPEPYTLRCNPSGGSGGLAPGTHFTQVAGLEAMVIVGSNYDPGRPTFLSFYLHGDSADDYSANEHGPVRQLVDEQGWIFVAPLAPSPYIVRPPVPYPHSWHTNSELNTERLGAVFDEMFARYNLCQDVLLGSGASGGSYFWDQYFFPYKGDVYPAYFSMNCGGGYTAFDGHYISEMLNRINGYDALKRRSRFHYRIGTEDFLYAKAQAGANDHRAAGFDTIFEPLEGVKHCAYDVSGAIREHWLRAVSDFNLNTLR